MISVNYSTEENIIYLKREGEVVFDDLLNLVYQLTQNFSHLREILIIDDVRQSESQFNPSDYEVLTNAIESRIDNFHRIRHAFIIDSPEDTVRSILFENVANKIASYTAKTFSTEGAARFWLQN